MKKVWIFWIISLLLAIVFLAVNKYNFRVNEIVKLEFSPSAQMMHANIMAIGCSPGCCYNTLKMNTIIDFGFIVSYSLLTLFSFKLFLDVFQMNSKIWWVYILSFITGCLDIIENFFLLKTAVAQKEEFSFVFFWAVRIKWAFAIVPLLLIPIVLLYGLILLLRVKQSG
jgi:hypothetical protein